MDGEDVSEDVNPGELPDEGDGDPVVPASRPVTSVPVRPRTTAGGRPLTSRGRPATSRPGTPATPTARGPASAVNEPSQRFHIFTEKAPLLGPSPG